MNITLQLNEEATDAVNKRLDEYNAAVDDRNAQLPEDATPEPHIDAAAYMAARNETIVAGWVKADYKAAVQRLGNMVAGMPYADRKALIAQVESAAE